MRRFPFVKNRRALPLAKVRVLAGCMAMLVCMVTAAKSQVWSADGKTIAVGGKTLALQTTASLRQDWKVGSPFPEASEGITALAAFSDSPSFTHDGTALHYRASDNKLFRVDLASRESKRIAENVLTGTAWSPDGKFAAYIQTNEENALHLIKIHPDGELANRIHLPNFKVSANSLVPPLTWIPNTDNMLIAGGEGNKLDLHLIDQGEIVQLTKTGDVLAYRVSQDGERVRWIRRSLNTKYILFTVYEMVLSRRTLTKVDFPEVVMGVNPHPRRSVDVVLSASLSPDLSHVAFVTRGGVGRNITPETHRMFVCDMKGMNLQTIAISNAPETGNTLGLPVFSSDGLRIGTVLTQKEKRYLLTYDREKNSRAIGLLP